MARRKQGTKGAGRPAKLSASISEADIQKAIINHLRLRAKPSTWWCHLNNNSTNMIAGKRNKSLGVVRGAPDLMFMIDGRCVFVELKTMKGVVSDAQKFTHAQIQKAGGEVHVARGLDAALALLSSLGAFMEMKTRV